MITLQDWITSSEKHPERAEDPSLTDEVKANATTWCDLTNACLDELEYEGPRILSSGFRPPGVNATTPGAAPNSGHMHGYAGDLEDGAGNVYRVCTASPEILRKHGLFVEDQSSTPGWCHLDYIVRVDRASRIFKP